MALQVVGVRLVADDGAVYIATLDKAEDAEQKLARGAKTAADGLTFMERAAKGAAERVGHLATDALADAGRAVLRFAVDGVKAAGDFESGMNNFASVVGGSLEEGGQSLAQFKDLFISLGRDLPVSTAEVQQAAIEMAKGGIEPATIAAGGLKQTLQFAAAGGLELADAATIAAKTIAGWSEVNATAEEKAQLLAHSTDLLARAANASTVNVDGLALGLYNVQGTARATGATLDETVTTLALLAPNFNSSAEAGNAMKNMLLRLQPATAPAAAEMARLGLLTKDGNSAFYDAQGHFIGMRATADKLQKALGGLSQAQKTQALRTIFGNDALNAANTLLEQGADGYDAMTASLAKQMGVAEQAKLKQQGFNTAVDNLMGSLEALQITVGGALLPMLTSLVGVLAGGVNAITDYAAATIEGKTALSDIAAFIDATALPTIYGLTAAVTAYAIVQAVQATPAIIASLPAIAAQTAAFVANAAAVALAIAPYALIAAAVGAVIYAWNNLQEQLESATQALLDSKPFWQESTTILEDFGNASEETRAKLQPLADSIKEQRALLEKEIESLGLRMAAGHVSEAQYAAEMEAINAQAGAIDYASKQLKIMADADALAAAASMTATAEAERLRGSTEDLGAQASLTAEDIEKLGKKIEDTYAKGAEAVQGYATNQSSFLADVEQRAADHAAKIEELEQKKNKATTADQKQAIDDQIKQANESYTDQETAAATSYAKQQAAQKAHLGQMLIDYTVAQASLGNISKDKAAEITGALEKAYGLQESSVASTFLKMAGSIDTFSKDASGDVDDLTKTLADQAQQAADTQKEMDAYAKTYTANAVANFVERKGEADDYIATLEDIPSRVASAIELPDVDDRIDDIKRVNRDLANIPKEVTVRIRVRDDRPEDIIPHSPTAFEVGLRGIQKALEAVGKSSLFLPEVAASLNDMTDEMNRLLYESDAPDEAEDLGENILEGMIQGIADNIGKAVDTGKEMIDRVIDGMNDAADVGSPSALTAETGANIGLGLVVGLEGMLPEVANTLQQLASMMLAGIDDLDEDMQQQTHEMVDNITGALADLGGQVSDALIGAFGGVADILRQQAGNLSDVANLDLFGPRDRAQIEVQLAQAAAEAGAIQDPEQAAKYYQLRSKQIMELAKLEQQAPVDAARMTKATDEEHAKNAAKLAADRAALIAENAQNDRDANEDVAALRVRLAAATNDVERGYLAQEIRDREAAQQAERARITQQITLTERAQEAETKRYQQALLDNQALADAEGARIAQQIALIKRAQEAELAALAEERSQGGDLQGLIDTIQTILDNIETTADDGPNPIIQALTALLVRLTAMQSFAGGGRYPLGEAFLVGESGPEILKMDRAGAIVPMGEMRSAMQPAQMFGGTTNHGGTINVGGITINGTGLGERALRRAIYGAVNDVANASDLRVRMGVG